MTLRIAVNNRQILLLLLSTIAIIDSWLSVIVDVGSCSRSCVLVIRLLLLVNKLVFGVSLLMIDSVVKLRVALLGGIKLRARGHDAFVR